MLPPFETLLTAHADAVLRYVSRRLPHPDAEDCFQDTLLAALAAYPRLRDASNLRGWLLTIARNKVADVRRGAGRIPLAIPDAGLEADSAAASPRGDADPELWGSVAALPPKQRRAVTLRFAHDQAYSDIAREMETSPEAARRSVHEGIRKLRESRT